MRAALYARQSHDPHGTQHGVDRQLEDCRSLAASRGWEVAAVHVDNDISAYTGKRRPGYLALLEQVRSGEVEAVVVWHPDRLTRNPRELEDLLDAVEARKVEVASVQAGDVSLSTPSGRAVARTLVAWGKHESEHKSARQRRAARQKAERGERCGVVPFGWRTEAEGDAVRGITERLLAGDSLASVARWLNETGVAAPRGGSWSTQQVRTVAARWANAGKRAFKGEVVADAVWPALVTEDDLGRVRRLLDGRKTGSQAFRRHLLSGVAVCGVCGGPMRWVDKGRGQRVYRCEARSCVTINADWLENAAVAALSGRLSLSDASGLSDPGAARTAALGRLEALRGRLDGLAADYADGVLDREQVRAASGVLRERVAAAEAEVRDLERREAALADMGVDVSALSTERRRALMLALFRLEVGRGRGLDRVRVVWQGS